MYNWKWGVQSSAAHSAMSQLAVISLLLQQSAHQLIQLLRLQGHGSAAPLLLRWTEVLQCAAWHPNNAESYARASLQWKPTTERWTWSTPEHVASLAAGTAPEAHTCSSRVETKPPGHCCYLYLCKTLQTPPEVRDSAATTLKDMYHPAVKTQAMYFLSCHLFYHLCTCSQRPEQAVNLATKALIKETTETSIWEREQPTNQRVPQLLTEISACKQENLSDVLPQVPQCHTLQ